jgi:Ca2+/Na+ antiporter
MKIEVKERGSKEFYDEMLYVITYCKKFIKNPKQKAWKYTSYLYLMIAVSIAMLCAFVAMFLFDKEWYSLVMIGAFVLMLIFLLFLFVTVKKRIKIFMEDKSEKTIEITKESIDFISETMNLKMKKEEISVITINKYSTCIWPKELNKYTISISNDYISQFLEGAKAEGYESIIVDNRQK